MYKCKFDETNLRACSEQGWHCSTCENLIEENSDKPTVLTDVIKKILPLPTKYAQEITKIKEEEHKYIKDGWTVISGIDVPSYDKSR